MARKTPSDTRRRFWRPRWQRLGAKLALWAMALQVLLPLGYPIAAQAFGNDRLHDIVIRTAVGEKSVHVGAPAGHEDGHGHHGTSHRGDAGHGMPHADAAAAAAPHDDHQDHGGPQCPICVIAQAISTGPLPTPTALAAAPEATSHVVFVRHDDRHDERARFDHRARAPPA